jgi:hypothetical protein
LKEYSNIIRAQLSKDELVLLFYNCYSIIKFSGNRYKKLIEKYQFFEHLEYKYLVTIKDKNKAKEIIVKHLLLEYKIKAFGNNKRLIEKINEIKDNI